MNARQAFGFLVTIEAIPGRQDDVIEFLEKARHLVDAERGTRTWYAFRSGPTTFGIFDTFDTPTTARFTFMAKSDAHSRSWATTRSAHHPSSHRSPCSPRNPASP